MSKDNLSTYKKIGVTAFGIIAASMLFGFMLFRGNSIREGIRGFIEIANPIIFGFVIAYVLSPLMTLIEKVIYYLIGKSKRMPSIRIKRFIRTASTFIAVFFAVWIVYELIALIVPELLNSIRSIIRNIPIYQKNFEDFLETYGRSDSFVGSEAAVIIDEALTRGQEWVNTSLVPQLDTLASSLTSQFFGFVTFIKNVFLGIIVSIYVLISKENLSARFRRLLYAVLSISTANRAIANLRFVDEKFGGFLIGKLIDSAIIGIITYVAMRIMNMPYGMLIAVVVGVTNIIPFFGPFIGAIPAAFLIFVVNPIQALYFIIYIIILQQFDGNILGPKILGSSVGVSSLMVIVAILIGSGFFGMVGMVIGVPLCAIILACVQNFELRRLNKKKLPEDLEAYRYVNHINEKESKIVLQEPDRVTNNLYDSVKYRGESIRKYDVPLTNHPWDRSIDDVLKEDSMINGTEYIPHHSEYVFAESVVEDSVVKDQKNLKGQKNQKNQKN